MFVLNMRLFLLNDLRRLSVEFFFIRILFFTFIVVVVVFVVVFVFGV